MKKVISFTALVLMLTNTFAFAYDGVNCADIGGLQIRDSKFDEIGFKLTIEDKLITSVKPIENTKKVYRQQDICAGMMGDIYIQDFIVSYKATKHDLAGQYTSSFICEEYYKCE